MLILRLTKRLIEEQAHNIQSESLANYENETKNLATFQVCKS